MEIQPQLTRRTQTATDENVGLLQVKKATEQQQQPQQRAIKRALADSNRQVDVSNKSVKVSEGSTVHAGGAISQQTTRSALGIINNGTTALPKREVVKTQKSSHVKSSKTAEAPVKLEEAYHESFRAHNPSVESTKVHGHAHVSHNNVDNIDETDSRMDMDEAKPSMSTTTTSSTATTTTTTTQASTALVHPVACVSKSHELLEGHRMAVSHLNVPDIYQNQLSPEEAPEYAVSSFSYMFRRESEFFPDSDYMSRQNDLTWKMRSTLNDWLVGVHWRFSMSSETLFLCVNITDRYLSKAIVPRNKLQLVGIVALLIAAKYEEIYVPDISALSYLCEDSYTRQEIIDMELQILVALGFDFGVATPITFLRRISKAENEVFANRIIGKYLIEITILSERFIQFKPSLIAAAAMWVARRIRDSGEWNATMQYYSSYTEEEILPCAQEMVQFLNTNSKYKSIYKKYNSSQFYRASLYVEQHLREQRNAF